MRKSNSSTIITGDGTEIYYKDWDQGVPGHSGSILALIMNGEDDQIVPVKNSSVKSVQLTRGAKEIYY